MLLGSKPVLQTDKISLKSCFATTVSMHILTPVVISAYFGPDLQSSSHFSPQRLESGLLDFLFLVLEDVTPSGTKKRPSCLDSSVWGWTLRLSCLEWLDSRLARMDGLSMILYIELYSFNFVWSLQVKHWWAKQWHGAALLLTCVFSTAPAGMSTCLSWCCQRHAWWATWTSSLSSTPILSTFLRSRSPYWRTKHRGWAKSAVRTLYLLLWQDFLFFLFFAFFFPQCLCHHDQKKKNDHGDIFYSLNNCYHMIG